MDTATIASKLNVSAKSLRRKIRSIGTFEKVDGQYTFTEADFELLKASYVTAEEAQEMTERLDLDMSPALHTSILTNYWSNDTSRKIVKDKWELRRQRLLKAIDEAL